MPQEGQVRECEGPKVPFKWLNFLQENQGFIDLNARSWTYTPFFSSLLAEAIRTARESRGMRQKDLAAFIGVHSKSVATWEHGRKFPHARHMRALVLILGLST